MKVDLEKYRIITTRHQQYLVLRPDEGIPIENNLNGVPDRLKGSFFFTTTCGRKIIAHVLGEQGINEQYKTLSS